MRLGISGKALLVHDLFVIDGGVFHLNQAMSGPMLFSAPSMRRAAAVFPQVVIHSPVEALVVSLKTHFLSHLEHFIEEMIIFSLDCSCLFF